MDTDSRMRRGSGGVARVLTALVSVGALAAATLIGASPVAAAPAPIIVWASASSAPVLQGLFGSTYQGFPVQVVVKDLAAIPADLQSATAETAPDIVEIRNADVGALAGSRLITSVALPTATSAAFPSNLWGAFRWGAATWGVPVMYETVGLVTNATLVPRQPKDFAELSKQALALAKTDPSLLPFAVAQAPEGDAVSTYPLFSGLGGYIFKAAPDGTIDPNDLGLATPAFLANARNITAWNASGLVRSSVSPDTARAAFVAGKAPFWLAPISELPQIMALRFPYRITSLPTIVPGTPAVPLVAVRGFAAGPASVARGHTVAVTRALSRLLARPASQAKLASAANLPPASTAAAATAPTTAIGQRVSAFGKASVGGVPVPNVPQTAQVWGPLGRAWLTSTAGPDAVAAKRAFRSAQRALQAAIAG